jgi:SAM-dependent methyltransferase
MQLSNDSLVIEVACNDGYLLQNFIELGIPCLGVEPTASTADAAEKLGIPVLREFFGEKIGKRLSLEGKKADLVVANNVFAHVPDINDFTRGLKSVLNVNGIISLEFSHLMKMLEQKQFDTIYHEHFSYLSLHSVERIFRSFNLRVWDVEELSTHGGSLRVFGCHEDDARETNPRVRKLLNEEKLRGLQTLSTYGEFQVQAEKIKNNLLTFLIDANCNGRTVAAYGAAAKGNTLLNFAGVRSDLLSYVVDAAVSKQNKYMPGSHIPILHPEVLYENPPDFLLILPWNIASEVRNAHIRLWELGTKFFTAVPTIEII